MSPLPWPSFQPPESDDDERARAMMDDLLVTMSADLKEQQQRIRALIAKFDEKWGRAARSEQLLAILMAGVPGPWRAMHIGSGTLPWVAIEDSPEPGKGRLLFLKTEEAARAVASLFNLLSETEAI